MIQEGISFCGYCVALLLMLQVVLRGLGGAHCSYRVSALLGEYPPYLLFSSVFPVYHPVQISEHQLLLSQAKYRFHLRDVFRNGVEKLGNFS